MTAISPLAILPIFALSARSYDVEDARLRSLSPAALAQRVAQAAAQLETWNLYAMVYTEIETFYASKLDEDGMPCLVLDYATPPKWLGY